MPNEPTPKPPGPLTLEQIEAENDAIRRNAQPAKPGAKADRLADVEGLKKCKLESVKGFPAAAVVYLPVEQFRALGVDLPASEGKSSRGKKITVAELRKLCQ